MWMGQMLEYLDHLFANGYSPEVGQRFLAAWRAIYTRYSRHGDRSLPRVARALKGWSRVMPSVSRWPIPWPLVAAAMIVLWKRKERIAAMEMALSYIAYLRPAELHGLAVRNLVPPPRPGQPGPMGRYSLVVRDSAQMVATKTGQMDESVILDRPDLLWMDRLWEALARGRPADTPLVPLSQEALAREIKDVFLAVGVEKFGGRWRTPCATDVRAGTSSTSSGVWRRSSSGAGGERSAASCATRSRASCWMPCS